MTLTAFILILFSVSFHSIWNLLAKKSEVSVAFYTLLCTFATLVSHTTLYWTPLEYTTLPGKFYLYLLGSVTADCIYCSGLVGAYRRMDMSSAYPLMRSLPLLLTIGVTTIFRWGAPLPWYAICGMVMAFAGCMFLPLKKFSDFNWRAYLSPNLLFVFIAACGTTGYTVLDSRALKIIAGNSPEISKTVISLSYYAIRGVILFPALHLLVLCSREERKKYLTFWRKLDIHPFLGGIFAACSYASVLIAMNYVDNVSYVQMLRLLALPMGVFSGIFFLKEKAYLPKISGVIIVLTGMLLIFF